MVKQAFLNWSTGKDAAFALYQLQQKDDYHVVRLLTTVNSCFERVSMHGVSVEVLKRQVAATGIPLDIVYLNSTQTLEEYQEIIDSKLIDYKSQAICYSVYGDILLEGLKVFREQQLAKLDIVGVFPLWRKNTKELLLEMLDCGLKTIVVCVNELYLDKSFLGRTIDKQFLEDLPEGVDPCGENGEFHTFVYDGPMFAHPVNFELGEVVYKTYPAPKDDNNENIKDYGFWFLDLL